MVKKSIQFALYSLGLSQVLLQSNFLNAEDCCPDPCCGIVGGEPLEKNCIAAGYPLSAIIQPDCTCRDIYVRGDFLYWCQIENEQQIFAQRMSFDGRTIRNFHEKGGYKPAFRVAAGVEVNTWLVDFTYVRAHMHYNLGVNAQPNQLVELTSNRLTGPPLVYSSVDYSLHLNLDFGLLSLRQPVYLGKRLMMNLGFGLLGFWTERKRDAVGTAFPGARPLTTVTANGTSRAHHKSWSLGPALSFDIAAMLPCGFKLIGNFIVCGEYANLYKGVTEYSHPALLPLIPQVPQLIQYNTRIPSKKNVPHLSATDLTEIGISWGSYLWCDRFHVDLSLTYAFMYHGIVNFAVPVNAHAVDLFNVISYGVHGITVGGRFDF
ncbi:MAG: hypothetical protein JSS30_02750 [Verrucomicrobia bacterium]|nr:hypothetical protein [Verrucomicrobiota bacterium]